MSIPSLAKTNLQLGGHSFLVLSKTSGKGKIRGRCRFPGSKKKKRRWTAGSPFQAFWWWGRLVAGYSQTFTVFILASKWFRFTPPSFTSLNPLETFFRSLQPHSSSHNWGKYENSRFNSDASGLYIELENAVTRLTRNKPCTRNQVASEWVKKKNHKEVE